MDPLFVYTLVILIAALLVIIPIVLLLSFLGILSLASLRGWLWHRKVKQIEREHYQQTHRADGTAYPPTGRGICQECQKAMDEVFFLPEGMHLCRRCYHKKDPTVPLTPPIQLE